ncbi:MAG TPA: nicotinamide riboside transporter PnuC [Bacteroidaceae bacterium]|nr:nicotinamide riboside transporter PnuC [Bacteroidaceae bacterium]
MSQLDNNKRIKESIKLSALLNRKIFKPWDYFLIIGFISLSLIISLTKGSFEPLSFTGGLFGILCVVFGAKGNILNFAFGLIGSAISGYIALKTGLYAYAALFFIYNIPMQFFGFSQWRKRVLKNQISTIKTRWMSWPQRFFLFVISAASIIGLGFLLKQTDDAQPFMDATVTTVMVVAQFVLTFAFIEQWFMWIIVNVTTISIWAIATAHGEQYAAIMMVQSFFYLLNSLYGVFQWSKLAKSE